MSNDRPTLAQACRENALREKILLAPSLRIAHQWMERTIRGGQPIINLRPLTLRGLAMEIAAPVLAKRGAALLTNRLGGSLVEQLWSQLSSASGGYLGRLEQSARLGELVFRSLLSLKFAGIDDRALDPECFEVAEKAVDIAVLLRAYEARLDEMNLFDEADIPGIAVEQLSNDPGGCLSPDALVLAPDSLRASDPGRRLLDLIPPAQLCIVSTAIQSEPYGDLQRLRALAPSNSEPSRPASGFAGVSFFRAVGESNEAREVLRRCLAEGIALDSVEILHTDAATYIPLLYSLSSRWNDGVSMTFAEGIPVSLSRPGRALQAWSQWVEQGFPQPLLVRMIHDGLLEFGLDSERETHSFESLARLLRPLSIGLGADRYLPRIDEQLAALKLQNEADNNELAADDAEAAAARRAVRIRGYRLLRKTIAGLLEESATPAVGIDEASNRARAFLEKRARTVNEFDNQASLALRERIDETRRWVARIGAADQFDASSWISSISSEVRVMGSGPRPGKPHVAHLASGGHSGRPHTFVLGLAEGRFPGPVRQDPILLDRERERLSEHLATSGARYDEQLESLALNLSRLAGQVTLSWPCLDLRDNRELFPGPLILNAFRIASGKQEVDHHALAEHCGSPASFAPDSADKALNASESWLWRLGQDDAAGRDCSSWVESEYEHLRDAARLAVGRRQATLNEFSGLVPRAGADLDPAGPDPPTYSPSGLELAGRCPLAFFFKRALRAEPPDEPEVSPDLWLEPAPMGSLLHEVFHRFLLELEQANESPRFDRHHKRLAEILLARIDGYRELYPAANESAFRQQVQQLVRVARVFLRGEQEWRRSGRPRYFEVALGLPADEAASGLDCESPIELTLPGGGGIRCRGRIDRVDYLDDDPRRLAIWDYKTGSGWGYEEDKPHRGGRHLQNALYARMLQEVVDPEVVVEQFGYFFPGTREHGRRVVWQTQDLHGGGDVLQLLVDVIRGGAFLATNKPDIDCGFCDYREVCGDLKESGARSSRALNERELVQLNAFAELRDVE